MKKRRLGTSSMVVSEIGLGTMTFGSSCDEETAFKIMDLAYESGIDFFDTAEIYPVPPEAKWVHRTEEIVGKWMKGKPRDSIILATKVCGPGHGWFVPPVRSGKTALDRVNIRRAIEGSLERLQTDYIDLYQTHWPDHDMRYEDTLEVLTELEEEGLIRAAGCSNETAWGLMKALQVSEYHGLIKYRTIQNNFSMVNRRFEDALAQVCRKEQVSLLPYSPLAGGVLSGKYNDNQVPKNARFTKYLESGERQKKQAHRFVNDKTLSSTAAFHKIAAEAGIHPIAMAVAWSKQHDFVASTLIGANTPEQLREILGGDELILSPEILAKIDEVSKSIMYPMN
ncbi:MAG TPA: aldo/keto reductase [Leptospiraceae bacterium]|nr:aldo/keto reductase [Leptospirales bacterium]HMU84109.1 aldo/keto reductase [Leptospiraceae bacterium]HMW59326.1 aldo/keto reductase [Leptospiraceae bacterium]HMX55325.1 aldo/keto reductase [Leptospiraceae bacterium]HMY45444.1 aldo/keto reductase [Leptospiraceae bacterium]